MAFHSYIFSMNGKFYVQEDIQDGEIWSEEEIWGSTLYDLDNMKEMTAEVYVYPPGGWSKYLKHDDWWDDIYVGEKTAKAIEYYKDIIEKIKNNEEYTFE